MLLRLSKSYLSKKFYAINFLPPPVSIVSSKFRIEFLNDSRDCGKSELKLLFLKVLSFSGSKS